MLYPDNYRKLEHYEYVSTNEINEIISEIKKLQGCIIYGAGKYANAVVKALIGIDSTVPITGIAVTDIRTVKVNEIEGVKVKGIEEYEDMKNHPVLIATDESFHEEIFNYLVERGYKKIVPLSQLHITAIGEVYIQKRLEVLGFDTDILYLMNIKRLFKDLWKNRFNNMCDLFGNIKMAMYQKATEETADYVVENMLNARCYENRASMYRDVCRRVGDGLFLEFGVASGGSINVFADLRKDKVVYGFDWFGGMPEDWLLASTGFKKGDICQNTLPKVRDNVELIVGLFEDTLLNFLEEHKEPISFLHVDCDFYSSTKYILENLIISDRIISGTEIIFDDYMNFPGWLKESEHTAFVEIMKKYDISFEYTGFSARATQVSVRIL